MKEIQMVLSEAVVFGTGLLTIINPPSILPAYTEIVSRYPKHLQWRIAVRTGFALMILLVVVIWSGQYLLSVLDLHIGALQIAGGLILVRAAIRMVDANDRDLKDDEKQQMASEPWTLVAVVPLATPLSAGGGVIAYLVASTSQFNSLGDLSVLSLVSCVIAVIVGIIYRFALPLVDLLGPIGMRIMVRIGGIILMAIAIQLISKGVSVLLPGLAA